MASNQRLQPSMTAVPTQQSRLHRIGRFCADLLFPPQCVSCSTFGHPFCPRCQQSALPVAGTVCLCCGRTLAVSSDICLSCQRNPPAFTRVRAATQYTQAIRSAIHSLKYYGNIRLAETLSCYLSVTYTQHFSGAMPGPASSTDRGHPSPTSIDACVPVPLHPRREAARGYNQSVLLANHFASRVRLPVWPHVLIRTRETASQTLLSPSARRQNVTGAFQATCSLQGKRLLLVDDVMTSGSTLDACAEAFQQAGAVWIGGLILAVPIPRTET